MSAPGHGAASPSADDWFAVQQLYAAYAQAVDSGDWDAWCALFTDDACYRLVPRENHERGLPLATLWFESRAMLQDRAYAIRETLFHDPYQQRHVMGLPRLLAADADGFDCETPYAVFRTKRDGLSEVFNVGRSLDRIVRTPGGLRLARRVCVYDSEWVPNSLIYPI